MRYLIVLLLFSSIAFLRLNSEGCAGSKEIEEVEIIEPVIYDFLKNQIIAEVKKLDIDSQKYDLYVYLSNVSFQDEPGERYFIVSIESSCHTLYVISRQKYTIIDGYVVFLDPYFAREYTKKTGRCRTFEFDYREDREDPEDSYVWSYWLVGDYRHPSDFVVRSKKSELSSSEKGNGMIQRLLDKIGCP